MCSVQMTGNHTEAKQDKGAGRKNSSCAEVTASRPEKKEKAGLKNMLFDMIGHPPRGKNTKQICKQMSVYSTESHHPSRTSFFCKEKKNQHFLPTDANACQFNPVQPDRKTVPR